MGYVQAFSDPLGTEPTRRTHVRLSHYYSLLNT